MKRSVAVTLAVMGTAALAGCGDHKIETAVYRSVDECVAGGFSRQRCTSDYELAFAEHQKNAPAYKSKEDCEAEFGMGKCETSTPSHATGSGSFVPFMLGYMLGGSSSASSSSQLAPQALYREAGKSNFVNAAGAEVSKGIGRTVISSWSNAARTPPVQTSTLSRGGFGARAMSAAG